MLSHMHGRSAILRGPHGPLPLALDPLDTPHARHQAAAALRAPYLYREVEQYRDRLARENAYLQEAIAEAHGFEGIVGESPALRAVLRKVQQVAPVEATVLLSRGDRHGQGAHRPGAAPAEPRRERPLIKVNCGAIPQGVVESELFGRRAGGLHRGAARPDRALRAGRPGHPVHGRGRGAAAGDPGEAAAGAAGARVRAGRQYPDAAGGRAAGGRDQPGPGRRRWRGAGSGPTCTTGSTCFRSGCRRCGSGRATWRSWSGTSWPSSSASWPSRCGGLTPESLARLERYSWPGNIRELQNVLERACVLSPGP